MKAQQSQPDLEIAEFLREIDYGPDENRPEAEVLARIGQPALDAWEARALPPPGWQVDPDALTRNWRTFFQEIAKDAPSGPVLVVTSNGIARFALLATRQEQPETPAGPELQDLKLKTGAYGILDISPSGEASMTDWNLRP